VFSSSIAMEEKNITAAKRVSRTIIYRGFSLIIKNPPTLGPPLGPRHDPIVGSYGELLPYKRGTLDEGNTTASERVSRNPRSAYMPLLLRWYGGCIVQIRQLWDGKGPGRTGQGPIQHDATVTPSASPRWEYRNTSLTRNCPPPKGPP